ncbi:MAG: glycoside hydrolase family 172 protein, partial [Ginsengibacter sp.]
TPNEDTLDFYFGGSQHPSFSIKFSDLFSGKISPFTLPLCGNQLGGYYCYFPILYQNGCKIVSRGKHIQFYQIQYRNFPDGYRVKNFNHNLNSDEKSSYEKLITAWDRTYDPSLEKNSSIKSIHSDKVLSPGETITLATINNGGRIVGIKLKPAEIFTGLQKQIDIRISWDDEKYPAIYAPVADFFGYAFGKPSMQSLLLGSANDINYCYFPMPFDSKAKIELIYRPLPDRKKLEPLRIKADIYYSSEKRNPKTEGKFYALWNKDINPPLGKPHVFLDGKGKGHYVGTILQAQGLRPGMTRFFEGDDVTFIDGKMTMHGTGSEDYFNGGWYALLDRWDRKMSLPLHGSLDYSLPFARTGGYRLFLSDKMSFDKSIQHTMEHGPENNNIPVDYTSVALYYATAAVSPLQQPTNELTKVFIPDTMMIYRQLMKFSFDGTFTMDGDAFITRKGGHLQIDLAEIPKGKYQLYVDGETSEDGAAITIWQRQTLVSKPVSFYSPAKEKKQIYLCDITIDDFKNTITLHFDGDENKRVSIERLVLIRK